ncbi:glycosyl transferase group 1 [Fibrella aestuarina BUZ 2]|uniref:Glycosyl transferase group 1 n=1 Tax=Fibrella aestuarina BUZ 2 TaxID=1166018 RepID=I0K653_9BACT|nr:glycosyltransferase family 4 protein [Fibrella aestuarina]CCG99606.1 glycosyl transferase group 1 [Fibrella aestuarina BUZ 2]
MTVLLLSYYFEPDLSAGSFRNTSLAHALACQLGDAGRVHVITTQPNRYQSFRAEASADEQHGNLRISRIAVPNHSSGFVDQIRSYSHFYRSALTLTRHQPYDLIIASSSRLFSAFLGAYLARQQQVPLVLDIRDLFRENILELLRNPVVRLGLGPVLTWVEQYTFGTARHINLVSAGFADYFSRYQQATYSFFTNGIDDPFLDFPATPTRLAARPRVILYAGNIGEGQGLEKIIPAAAQQLGSAYRFVVIGDGGTRARLQQAVHEAQLTNVTIHPPMSRHALLADYEQADYLFMHLNDLKAFERCLPSKLFEYGATDKPLIAGVAGYAAQFVRQYVPNSLVFAPGDVAALVELLRHTPYRNEVRTAFIEQFRRQTISQGLANRALEVAGLPRSARLAKADVVS